MGPILESIRNEELQTRNVSYSHLSNQFPQISQAYQLNPPIPTLEYESTTVSASVPIPIPNHTTSTASSTTPESGSTSTTPVSDTTASDTD